MIASIWTTFFGTRERDMTGGRPGSKARTPFSYITATLHQLRNNRPFRMAVSIFLVTNCAATLIVVNFAYFLDNVLNIKSFQTGIIAVLLLTASCLMPIWVYTTKRYGKAETYRPAMILFALVLFGLPFLPTGNVYAAYGFAIVAGFFYAAALMIPWAMIPDVVEYD